MREYEDERLSARETPEDRRIRQDLEEFDRQMEFDFGEEEKEPFEAESTKDGLRKNERMHSKYRDKRF